MIPYFEDVPAFKMKEKKYEVTEKVVDFDEYLMQNASAESDDEEKPPKQPTIASLYKKNTVDNRMKKKTRYDLANQSDWRDASAD